jgi:uncharacterized protein YbjT (DUF2867 family)
MIADKKVLIFGATGNAGGAASRELLQRGWRVRAVTRTPDSDKARALAILGAEVVHGDMNDRASLERNFAGMERVLSVQNWTAIGASGEARQGKLVADAAQAAGVQHLVYVSAGTGDPDTGVPHFESKLEVEAYMRGLGLPFTILRPAPFMELLTEKEFYPALGVWGAKIKILGWDAPIPWVAVHDLGIAIAKFFEHPETWVGQDVSLFGDIRTMRECRQTFMRVLGKKPFRIPLPLGLFQKMAGEEFVLMWRWLAGIVSERGPQYLNQILEESRRINPDLLDMESWLEMKRTGIAVPAGKLLMGKQELASEEYDQKRSNHG